MPRHFWIILFAGLILVGPGLSTLPGIEIGTARADDDGDNGDDGDDDQDDFGDDREDDDDGNGWTPREGGWLERPNRQGDRGFWRRLLPRQKARSTNVQPSPAPPRPAAVDDEIVVLSLSTNDLAALEAEGFTLIEERSFAALETPARRLRIPPSVPLDAARAMVRARPTGQDADLNHFYRSEQGFDPDCNGLECPIRAAFGWPIPETRDAACGAGVRIGVVDTGLNPEHETFEGASLTILDFKPLGDTTSRALHGTAVSALLVGRPGTRSPGLVPRADVIAIDPFHRQGSDERADVFSLMDAMDRVTQADIDVLNLSLAGPRNAALEAMVQEIIDTQNIIVVAAAGNDGPHADPLYPAAFDGVIAVTAIDRNRNVYRRAVQGSHIDLAAPGVAVWTAASVRGAKWKTGTSFAVPFVTAAAGLVRLNHPKLTPYQVLERLKADAADLGVVGEDTVFGAGVSPVVGSLCEVRSKDRVLQSDPDR